MINLIEGFHARRAYMYIAFWVDFNLLKFRIELTCFDMISIIA